MYTVIKLNNKTIKARASLLALWFYRLQFKKDMTAAASEFILGCERLDDLIKRNNPEEIISGLRSLLDGFPRLLWAMVKAQAYADSERVLSWEDWSAKYGAEDYTGAVPGMARLLIGGFYSDVKPAQTKKSDKSGNYNDTVIIAGCKYMNLTMPEMNELTMQGFIELQNAYTGEDGEREADQNDIDLFYSK